MSALRLRRIPPLDEAERLFLALAGDDHAAAAATGAAAAAGAPIWDRVARLAVAHQLAGHLYARREGAWWQACPPPVRALLGRHYAQNAMHGEALLAELGTLLADLAGRGATPVLLKGAALLPTVHRDPGLRPLGDVDLLVPSSRVDEAGAALAARGYVIDEAFQDAGFYRRHHYHLIWRHPERPWLCIEVHWDVSLPMMDVRWNARRLREGTRPITVAGAAALVPAPQQLLLHLALHAALNGFSLLGQVRDVAAAATVHAGEIAPEPLWTAAAAGRVAVPLRAALELASRFWPRSGAPALLAARPAGPDPLLLRLLSSEAVLRQRLRRSAAGGAAASLLRRQGAAERLAWLWRQPFPTAAVLGMEGHLHGKARGGADRLRRLRRLGLPMRGAGYLTLALVGLEAWGDAGSP